MFRIQKVASVVVNFIGQKSYSLSAIALVFLHNSCQSCFLKVLSVTNSTLPKSVMLSEPL